MWTTLYDKVKDSVIYATTDPGTGTLVTSFVEPTHTISFALPIPS
jgi:hypothetical protein